MSENTPPSQEVILLKWTAPEFNDLKRGPIWYTIAAIIAAVLLLYGILSGSIVTVVVFLILAGAFLATHHKKPKHKSIRITDIGVHYGRQFYPYHHIQHFWVVYHPPYIHCLYLKVTGKRNKVIRIQLNGQAPNPIRQLLSKEVKELEGGNEPFFDAFNRILRLQ